MSTQHWGCCQRKYPASQNHSKKGISHPWTLRRKRRWGRRCYTYWRRQWWRWKHWYWRKWDHVWERWGWARWVPNGCLLKLSELTISLEWVSKDWSSPVYVFFHPIPSIEYIKDRHVHVFECSATHCKGKGNGRMVRRYLDTSDARLVAVRFGSGSAYFGRTCTWTLRFGAATCCTWTCTPRFRFGRFGSGAHRGAPGSWIKSGFFEFFSHFFLIFYFRGLSHDLDFFFCP